jgi:MATE family multidrug resistance protein
LQKNSFTFSHLGFHPSLADASRTKSAKAFTIPVDLLPRIGQPSTQPKRQFCKVIFAQALSSPILLCNDGVVSIMSSASRFDRFLSAPFRTFFLLWAPVLFSMIAEPLTGLIDTAFVARLGAEELAALGVGTVVLSSGLWAFNFLSVGSQTEISQSYGRKDLNAGRRIGSLALSLAILIGVIIGMVIFIFGTGISTLMGADGDIFFHAVTYIRFRAIGVPAVLVTMASFGILYGLGDMRMPLFIAFAVNGMNIVLDYMLIFGYGPFPPMGIAGAAIASTASQWTGAVYCLVMISKKLGFTSDIHISDLKKLMVIGRDMFFRTGSLILFLLLATRFATRLGPDSGAAHQAIRQVWVFTALFLDASAITAQSLIGYFFGPGRIDNARAVARLVCIWTLLIGFALMAVMLLGSNPIAKLLVPLSSIALFHPAWMVSALFQPIAAIAFVTDGIHWGTGDFRYLRNAVVVATVIGSSLLFAAEVAEKQSLSLIWGITGIWVLVRSVFGIVRIWPGTDGSPLRHK